MDDETKRDIAREIAGLASTSNPAKGASQILSRNGLTWEDDEQACLEIINAANAIRIEQGKMAGKRDIEAVAQALFADRRAAHQAGQAETFDTDAWLRARGFVPCLKDAMEIIEAVMRMAIQRDAANHMEASA